jgi:hypothetical protein
MDSLLDINVIVWTLSAGTHHNAVLTDDNKVYTWGSNKCGCLGRDTEGQMWTAEPGIIEVFDAMVDRVGRGPVQSIACGKEYTLVATLPYTGPSEEELLLMEKEAEEEAAQERMDREREIADQERNRVILEQSEERSRVQEEQRLHPFVRLMFRVYLCNFASNCAYMVLFFISV